MKACPFSRQKCHLIDPTLLLVFKNVASEHSHSVLSYPGPVL